MRVLLLSDVNSAHTKRWATSLSQQGIDLAVFSISTPDENWTEAHGISLHTPMRFQTGIFSSRLIAKSLFLKLVPHLKKVIRQFNPDIVHAHYATSYGMLGALAGFHPFVISVWGSDVLQFPKHSLVGKLILHYNFKRADAICSTSLSMIPEIQRYTRKNILVVPFGIDLQLFHPFQAANPFTPGTFIIGTIKALEPEYGIDLLIRTFHAVKQTHPEKHLKLLIVGGGRLESELKNLAISIGISEDVVFQGKVPHHEVPMYYNMLDLFVALSRTESFGVSVLEAAACEKPVVVSDVGGLPEVVENGVTGLVVPDNDLEAAVQAVESLMKNNDKAREMGQQGRIRVEAQYNWTDSVKRMTNVYQQLLR
ncbi:MAG: glycosyltransferase [Bacteroidales bacterium]|nr:glycosyltransferase [Bacteroidales bacterium]